jgi:hypothetical protein
LKAIDRRSLADIPWWAESNDDLLGVGEDNKMVSRSHDVDAAVAAANTSNVSCLAHHRRLATIPTPIQIACVLLVGIRSPSVLAGVATAILSFVYLPTCIELDLQCKSFVERMLFPFFSLQKEEE